MYYDTSKNDHGLPYNPFKAHLQCLAQLDGLVQLIKREQEILHLIVILMGFPMILHL